MGDSMSKIEVDSITNQSGDQDSGINLGTNDTVKFDIAGSTKWTLNSSGNLFPSSTSQGICFGVTSDTASNRLSDYEEGTWTPAYTFSGGGTVTHGSRAGNYIKVGNLVQVGFNIRSTGVSSLSGSLTLTGLPFPVKNATGARMGGSVGFNRDWGADMPNFRIYTSPNSSQLNFYYNAMNATSAAVGTSQFATGSDHNVIEATAVYITE